MRWRGNGRSWALVTFRTDKEAAVPLRSGFKDVFPVPPAWVTGARSERAATAAARALEELDCPPLAKARGILARRLLRGVPQYLLHWWPSLTTEDESELGPTRWIPREALAISRLCVGYIMEFETVRFNPILIRF